MLNTELYAVENSAFYRVKAIHQLAKVLLISVNELQALENSLIKCQGRHYSVFTINNGSREIQNPIGPLLKRVQRRTKYLLSLIKPPEYLQSGRRGKSYIDNAKLHLDSSEIMTMDIKGFYKNTRGEVIFQFFHHKMGMISDLAHLMTNLCTFEDGSKRRKIPTGSTLSQLLAYWAYSDMFNKINNLAVSNGITFSLYVDDMTFSTTNSIPKDFYIKIQEILATRWLRFKSSKLIIAHKNEVKRITGCVITTNHRLTAPNKLKKKVVASINKILNLQTPTQQDIQKTLGLIQSVRQIDSDTFKTSYHQIKSKLQKIVLQNY